MEAGHVQNLQSQCPSLILTAGNCCRTENWCSRLKAISQEEPTFQCKGCLSGRKNFSYTGWGGSARWGPPTLWTAICLTQSHNVNVNLNQVTPSQKHQKKFGPNVWAPHGLVKLTYKINQHTHTPFCKSILLLQGLSRYCITKFMRHGQS